ncbi:MAG: hypothetical protein K0M70_04935 [Arenimonas sp.]|uniref:hypothetical protein n=1 Tax=Arenimonas sp. TaxID=1872635 RepID=UPI0025BDFDBA|nr:hypothetical protein [Arenimonas sp.]MBW8367187.1 hypothetical protein [Arenimonas sp.]
MSNVITFLEKMGNNPSLASQSQEDYAAAVDALGLDDAPRQALLDRDPSALNGLLGGRMEMMCLLYPADGEEKKDTDEPVGDEDQPVNDEPKSSIRHTGRH